MCLRSQFRSRVRPNRITNLLSSSIGYSSSLSVLAAHIGQILETIPCTITFTAHDDNVEGSRGNEGTLFAGCSYFASSGMTDTEGTASSAGKVVRGELWYGQVASRDVLGGCRYFGNILRVQSHENPRINTHLFSGGF